MSTEQKEIIFAYCVREVVNWASDNSSSMYIKGMHLPADKEYVYEQVAEMRKRGWDSGKILWKCSAGLPENVSRSPARHLAEIIHAGHPIVEEWNDLDVRRALHRKALMDIATTRAHAFDRYLLWSRDPLHKKREERVVGQLEEFASRLTQEATPAIGIRNR